MNRVQSLIDTDEASTSDQGTSGQESTLNRGGRPQDRFRRIHFKELSNAQGNNNRKALACKSCGAKVESQNLYLQKHCLGECEAISAIQKRKCERQIPEDTFPAKRPATGLSRSSKCRRGLRCRCESIVPDFCTKAKVQELKFGQSIA